MHEFFENAPAMLVALKLVEAGAGGASSTTSPGCAAAAAVVTAWSSVSQE